MAYVLITRDGEPVRELAISGPVTGIGRDTRNEVCLTSESNEISRFHAVLVSVDETGTSHFIRDLSSVRGLRVNGTPVYQRILSDGDTIDVAGYELIYSRSRGANAVPRIRIVQRKHTSDGNATTKFPIPIRIAFSAPEREELVQEMVARATSAADLRSFIEGVMPALVRVVAADRGFAGLFRGSGFDDVGLVSLTADDQIELSAEDFMERLRRGETVRDGLTLLVPMRERGQAIGFLCVDRSMPALPFDAEDERFLAVMARLMCGIEGRASAPFDAAVRWPRMLVGKSRPMQKLLFELDDAAASGLHVLIQGESGTGKEMVAESVHRRSAKRDGVFLARSCATITESLADSEVFGYAPRAGISGADPSGMPGWFEMAHKGVLFLDEIQSLSPALQERFLRVLEERQVWRVQARSAVRIDVLVIAATDVDLDAAVEQGTFRKALYHRFGRKLFLPPLRERIEDVRLLAHYFLDLSAAERGTRTRIISQRALARLTNYSWPGNVRELQNCILSCATRAGEVLFSWDLPEYLPEEREAVAAAKAAIRSEQSIRTMVDVEKEKIMEALLAYRGNATKAAQALGYKSRITILNKMDQYGIPRDFGDVDAAVR